MAYTRTPGLFERSYLDLLTHNDRLLVDSAENCWPWGGGITAQGYGKVGDELVHRVVYAAIHGPIPDGLDVHHSCRNRRCGNPAHLAAVTRPEHYRLDEQLRKGSA